LTPHERTRMIGEKLLPKVRRFQPDLAPKITGMLLQMNNTELLVLLNDEKQLIEKISETLITLTTLQSQQ